MDFLHYALGLRGLQKEPPYLWQPLSPDGRNLEHWAGGMKRCGGAGGKEGWKMKGEERE